MIKVALVGTGFIATQKHLPAWRKIGRGASLVALSDVDQSRGQEVARRFGVPSTYTDVQEMLEEERPDIVDICTPPRNHAELAVTVLEGGAHVLIEKPMAVSTDECDTIIAAAETAGRQVCVAHSDLFYPSFKRAQQMVDQGAIGEFTGMRIFLSTPADYMTAHADHWANKLPGGVIGESGPHIVYMTLAFIDRIRDVKVHGQKLSPQFPWSPFEDYRVDLIGDHAVSSVTLTYATNQWAAQVDLWGTNGRISIDLESQSLVRHSRTRLTPKAIGLSALGEARQTASSVLAMGAKVILGRFQNTHDLLVKAFYESVRDGGAPPVPPQEGREAVRVMDMIVEKLQRAKV